MRAKSRLTFNAYPLTHGKFFFLAVSECVKLWVSETDGLTDTGSITFKIVSRELIN